MDTTVLVIIAVGVAILFDIAFVWYRRNRQISPIKSDQNRGFQKKIQRSYQHLSNVPKKIKNLPGRVLTKEKFSVGILTSCSIPQNAIDELNESAASQNATAKITKVSAVFVDEFWCVIVEYTNNATGDTYKLYKTLYRQNVTCTSHITRSTCRDLWLGSPGHRASALEKFLTKQQTANPLCSPDLLLSVIKYTWPICRAMRLQAFWFDRQGLHPLDYPKPALHRFADTRLVKAALGNQPLPYSKDELNFLAKHCTDEEDATNKVER